MSTPLAIAGVTAVLRDLLNNGVIDRSVATAIGSVKVTAVAPDLIESSEFDEPRLNLFMYMATPNPGWRNTGLPSHSGNGVRLSNAPLALDLHYLLTAYGQEDLHAEILLGYALHILHEHPVLTRAAITTALTPALTVTGDLPPALEALRATDLAEQVESIRLTPQVMSTEELSRLWSATQAAYRPSAAYLATVVLIEGDRRTKPQTGVVEPRAAAGPLAGPLLRSVTDPSRPDGRVTPGATVALAGERLDLAGVAVELDGAALPAGAVTAVRPGRITVALPPALPAGAHGVRLVSVVDTALGPRPRERSNAVEFLLHPLVAERDDGAGGTEDDITVSGLTGSGAGPRSAAVTVGLLPPVAPTQAVQLELLEGDAIRALVPARARTAATDPLVFDVSGIAAGAYIVRVRVDGADSPIRRDAANAPVGPLVVFP